LVFIILPTRAKQHGITFAKQIVKQGLKQGLIKKPVAKIIPCASEEYPLPAERPHYTILRNTKLSAGRTWKKALRDYINSEF